MSKRAFNCPECRDYYEVEPPDKIHPELTLEKSVAQKNARGTIIEKIFDCKNPTCRYPITLYWYQQKGFFV